MNLECPLIVLVIPKYVFLNLANKDIIFYFVDIGIRGHKKADSAAKSAFDFSSQGWCTLF